MQKAGVVATKWDAESGRRAENGCRCTQRHPTRRNNLGGFTGLPGIPALSIVGFELRTEWQMLAPGRALMSKPRLLMLDEPSLGLAPLSVREIFHTIAALKATGVSILHRSKPAMRAGDSSIQNYDAFFSAPLDRLEAGGLRLPSSTASRMCLLFVV